MKLTSYSKLFLLLTICCTGLASCGIYSLSGGSLDENIKTVSVMPFGNQASQVVPNLAEDLTTQLQDRFIKEMKLEVVDYDGDIAFEGAITDYRVAPASISGDQTAATTRLTITVKVKFENIYDEENNYETTFSNFIDFESSQNIADLEAELHAELTDMLITDIFNKAVNNW